MPDAPKSLPLQVRVPDELASGVYSNVAAVWHTAHDFTLDFLLAGMVTQDETGNQFVEAPVQARIKVAPSVVFQIAKAIADNVYQYEQVYGAITPRPEDPAKLFPPPEDDAP